MPMKPVRLIRVRFSYRDHPPDPLLVREHWMLHLQPHPLETPVDLDPGETCMDIRLHNHKVKKNIAHDSRLLHHQGD